MYNRYKVTKKHIADGAIQSKLSCPIALCIRQAHGGDVIVNSDVLNSGYPLSEHAKKYKRTAYALSQSIADWIKDFDNGNPVDEITLEVHGMYVCQQGEYYASGCSS